MIIKNIFNYLCSFFRVIYVFESKKNNNKIKFKNFSLKKYELASEVKDKELKDYLIEEKKLKRIKKNQKLYVLFYKKKFVSMGWMYNGASWKIDEINKRISLNRKILLWDFVTLSKFRNKGFYSKLLLLIKNLNTKKIFLIYCLKNNNASKAGILNSKFKLKKKIN
tara:strand:- start:210 stop:707 length:498 start_codon:yes stop_codon:yes gene_type:complete